MYIPPSLGSLLTASAKLLWSCIRYTKCFYLYRLRLKLSLKLSLSWIISKMIWLIIPTFFFLLLTIHTITRCQTNLLMPDIEVIQWIKDDGDFTDKCTTDLDATLWGQLNPQIVESPVQITAACIALDFSANVDPPASFSSGTIGKILMSTYVSIHGGVQWWHSNIFCFSKWPSVCGHK